MDSSTIAHDLRAREWRQIILEANNSDIPKSQYIREHHLSENRQARHSFLQDGLLSPQSYFLLQSCDRAHLLEDSLKVL